MSVQGRPGRIWFWILISAAGVAALLFYLSHRLPGEAWTQGHAQRLVALAAILVLVGGSVLARIARQGAPGVRRAAGQLAAWVAIGLVILVGYSYRGEFGDLGHRLSSLLLPAEGEPVDGRSMRFTLASDHQFHVKALVSGTPVEFLVDTGASDVLLSQADARRIGLDPASLSYTQLYRTASGTASGAPVTLAEIVVGPIRVTQVNASISEGGAEGSLLGMSFLQRLSGYEVSGDTLTLKQ
jgi:aspartyl protease family protein